MSRIAINVGSAGNDGTGNPLRTGGQSINSNFIELYNAPHPGYQSANYYAHNGTVPDDNSTVTASTLYIHPVCFRKPVTIHALAMVNASSVAASKARAGVYSMTDLSGGLNGTKLGETTTEFDISVGAGTRITQTLSPDIAITVPGWYWMVSCYSGAALAMYGYAANDETFIEVLGSTSATQVTGATGYIRGYTATFTYAALPATFAAGGVGALAEVSTGNLVMPKVSWKTA